MYPLDQLIERNKLTGYALWEALTLLVDYSTGGVGNQIGSPEFDDTMPQDIGLCVIDRNREPLPVDCYHYFIKCQIMPGKPIPEHIVSLTVTQDRPESSLRTSATYWMTVKRLSKLYPHLLTPDRDKFLDILDPQDVTDIWTD